MAGSFHKTPFRSSWGNRRRSRHRCGSIIQRRQKNDAGLTRINSFMTNSEVRPYLDVDGDGVPGIISLEWYNEAALRSFSPEIKVIAIDHSGV